MERMFLKNKIYKVFPSKEDNVNLYVNITRGKEFELS